MSTRDIIERSRRHHRDETAAAGVYIPGSTQGHFGGTKTYAKVTATLQKEDLLSVPTTPAIEIYKIRLLTASEPTAAPWQPNVQYVKGGLCAYDAKFYEALLSHLSHNAYSPANAAYWKPYTGEVDAGILHYKPGLAWDKIKLTETVPWFMVDDTVEVVEVKRAGDAAKKWYIVGTVVNTVYEEGNGVRRFSVTMIKTENTYRQASVFS
jgi:hypothetical protein